jgi:hypothetical protein
LWFFIRFWIFYIIFLCCDFVYFSSLVLLFPNTMLGCSDSSDMYVDKTEVKVHTFGTDS